MKDRSIVLAPVIILALMAIITLYPGTRDFGIWLLAENHPVETLTFMFLFIAGLMGLKLAVGIKHTHKRFEVFFYTLFSILLFIVSMEEIAWGQHIFKFETPEILKEINLQNETTLHNISGLQGKSEIFRFIYGLAGGIGIYLAQFRAFAKISPPYLLWSWFLIIGIHSGIDIYTDFFTINEFYDKGIQRTSELIELFIGISAFLYLWINRKKLMTK